MSHENDSNHVAGAAEHASTEPPPGGPIGGADYLFPPPVHFSVLDEFLAHSGLSAEQFCSLPATHLEFLGRQLLRSKEEGTRAVGEFSFETMADGSIHVSGTFPPGKLAALASSVTHAFGRLLTPEGMAMLAKVQEQFGATLGEPAPKRKRRSRKAATTPATPATGGQAPLDLGGAR